MNSDIVSDFSYERIVEYYMDCLLNGKEMVNREVVIEDMIKRGPFWSGRIFRILLTIWIIVLWQAKIRYQYVY